MFRSLHAALLGIFALAFAALPAAAEEFPSKEVSLIVNYGAGGTTDTATRILADKAEEFLGKPIAVLNRAGGAGTAGPSQLARSKPDGYTVGVTSLSPLTVTPHTLDVPFKTADFQFLLGYFRYVYGVGVAKSSPFKDFKSVVESADGGKRITWAVASTDERILVATLNKLTGANFIPVPFNSGSEREVAIMGGKVDLSIVGSASANVRSGELRLIAAAGPERWSTAPEVPTLIEQGFDASIESWAGLAAPAGTPKEAHDVLEAAFLKAATDPDVIEKLRGLGLDSAAMTGAEYAAFVDKRFKDNKRWIEELDLSKK